MIFYNNTFIFLPSPLSFIKNDSLVKVENGPFLKLSPNYCNRLQNGFGKFQLPRVSATIAKIFPCVKPYHTRSFRPASAIQPATNRWLNGRNLWRCGGGFLNIMTGNLKNMLRSSAEVLVEFEFHPNMD